MTLPYDAVLLSGGRASRMGGRDKPALTVGGRRLIDRVIDAVAEARRIVVVGPDPQRSEVFAVTREEPPGAGPVAALAAGLSLVDAPIVAVLAADLPFLTADVVRRLRTALEETHDVALLVDDHDHDQYLVALWWTERLRALLAGEDVTGLPVRRLVGRAAVNRVRVQGVPPPWLDCDTDEDLTRAREWA